MVKCGVLFEVRPECLNIIWTSVGFKGLILKLLECGRLLLTYLLQQKLHIIIGVFWFS
jgi:hypothetical protein